MIPLAFLALMRAFHAEGTPCRACVFWPWLALLVICASGMLYRRADAVCTDLMRLGLHVTALAMLYPHGAHQTFACSLHALLACSWALCRDDLSACALCLFGVCAVSALAHSCSFAVDREAQLNAMAWPCIVEALYMLVRRAV